MTDPLNEPEITKAINARSELTLRDYFAGQAMLGFMACPETYQMKPHDVAKQAYWHADAMLDERSKT